MATLQEQVNQQTAGNVAGMTMMPGKSQPEGTTGQIQPAPEQVVEAPQTVRQPIELETPAESPTTITTDSLRSQLDEAQTRLDALKVESATQPEQQPEEVVEQPPVEQADPAQAFIDNYTKETNKLLTKRSRDFDKYLTRSSNALKSQVNSIKAQFDVRRDSAEKVAANAKAATNVLGARTGRLRYAPEIQRGIITGQENDLITTLSEIDALEMQVIADAENAALERDYEIFLDKIEDLDSIEKERETTLAELETAMKEENQRREEEAQTLRQESLIIEQFAAGVTDPIEVFQALNGDVPYDMIVEYTTMTPGIDAGGELEFKTGSKYQPAGYFNTKTGEFTTLSQMGIVAGIGASVAGGGSVVGTGGAGVVGFPSVKDLELMSTEERIFVNQVLRQLPTRLRDSEKDEVERKREALFDYRRGRSIQEVVDEMKGFIVQDSKQQGLANVFRAYAIGSGVDLAEVSAAINNGNPTQAMTTIEKAKLDDVDLFFASMDDASSFVGAINEAERIMNDPEFNDSFLGSWDGRQFQAERFLGRDANNKERQLLQRLETQLAIINSPIRVSVAGTAATDAEMQKIQPFQTDIRDNPQTMKTILNQMQTAILQFHNAARDQRGLPTVTEEQLINNKKRLNLYKSQVKEIEEAQATSLSNKELLLGKTGGGSTMGSTGVPSVLEGL